MILLLKVALALVVIVGVYMNWPQGPSGPHPLPGV